MTASLAEFAAHTESMATPVALASHLHGPRHWRAVARVGAQVLREATNADSRSVFIFAAIHDTQRLNDGYDPDHGSRAAAVLEAEVDHGLDEERLELLLYALRHHSGGTGPPQHEDPTIAVCWDADRLTLDRVGIVPDPHYISTPAVRESMLTFNEMAIDFSEGGDLSWEEVAAAY